MQLLYKFLPSWYPGEKNCSGYVMCFCDCVFFICTDCLLRNSVTHFSVHKINSRVCFVTKQSSSWCKELHRKWRYQWIKKLPAFRESFLEVILCLLNPYHGIKIVVFLGVMLCSLSGRYQHSENHLVSYHHEDGGSRFNGIVGMYLWECTPSYPTRL